MIEANIRKIDVLGIETNIMIKLNENDTSSFYKKLAKKIVSLENDAKEFFITSPVGNIIYEKKQRGSISYFVEKTNTISLLFTKSLPEKHLKCVGYLDNINNEKKECNNYKYYNFIPLSDTNWMASWGRIGEEQKNEKGKNTFTYKNSLYWLKYYEKIQKSYIDLSDICVGDKYIIKNTNEHKDCNNDLSIAANNLAAKLFNQAKLFVDDICASTKITMQMYTKSKEFLDKLYMAAEDNNIDMFNDVLIQLLAICPRKVSSIICLLAHSENDFSRILDREEKLVNSMLTVTNMENKTMQCDIFSKNNISVEYATDKEIEYVKTMLSYNLKKKVKTVYRIKSIKQTSKFDNYVEKNNIKNKRHLWHGSRTVNWLSIINNSLQIRPNAKITGKMFGYGIYFAPSSEKSFKYTDGNYWAKGVATPTVFMGLYNTAYGEPEYVERAMKFTQNSLKSRKRDCVHALAGKTLRNDEIVFYDEAAVNLEYLVEFFNN